MKATFEDFIKQNPNCKKFEHDDDMWNVFEFLSRDYIITQMVDMCEAGKPALAPVARNVENFFKDITKEHTNTLDDNFTKQAVGLMIKTILAPFGYVVWKQKDLPKKIESEKFQSASVYQYSHAAPRTMRIVKVVEEINPSSSESEATHD
jgi:hypothetical protein